MSEKQYYYLNGNTKMGPFSLDTLKHAPIKPDTLVWNNTLSDWVEARTLPELQVFFVVSSQSTTPPVPPVSQNPQTRYGGEFTQQYNRFNTPPPMPENYMAWGILTLIFCFWPLSIVSIVSASKVSTCYYMGDYEGARKASEDAKKWATWSALTLLIIIGLITIFYIFIIAIAGAGVMLGNAAN
ncbi:MAG: CD225/dispanin family protein [Tannerella sp.]|jgi:hypothetical protein|nr:CD225/dispanin family protein [Tannerella sp.]